jgi:hypothetical protein
MTCRCRIVLRTVRSFSAQVAVFEERKLVETPVEGVGGRRWKERDEKDFVKRRKNNVKKEDVICVTAY